MSKVLVPSPPPQWAVPGISKRRYKLSIFWNPPTARSGNPDQPEISRAYFSFEQENRYSTLRR
jgi:hypothetical protein